MGLKLNLDRLDSLTTSKGEPEEAPSAPKTGRIRKIDTELTTNFESLYEHMPPEPPETGCNERMNLDREIPLDEHENASTGKIEGNTGFVRAGDVIEQDLGLREAQLRAKKEREQARKILQEYQRGLKDAERLMNGILTGMRNGENAYNLLLQAIQAIACLTSDETFYHEAEEYLKTEYGIGLQEAAPLEHTLQAAQKRLERLVDAERIELPPDEKRRLEAAITAHRGNIEKLQELIRKANVA